MNKFKQLWIIGLLALFIASCSDSGAEGEPDVPSVNGKIINFVADKSSLIRNPAMGWTMYDDASDHVADATIYWDRQDEIARKYASCFYLRWRWSELEPEEGKYAWEYDDNFKALIKGALDRGLKLAFRVYVNGRDNISQTTPQFVFDAGAKSYEVTAGSGGTTTFQTPYPDDPIFQEKFTNFVNAFAKEFDDPERVNYVDGYNLGWWGEGHHIEYSDPAKKLETFEWIINLYGNAFKKVPLVITLDSEIGLENERTYAFEGQGYSPRRDGYASQWFPEAQKNLMRSFFPENMIVAEAAYWGAGSISYANNIENQYTWSSWGDYYKQVVSEALTTHANFLDLREAVESARYVSQAKKEVEKFMVFGGYRLYPTTIEFLEEVSSSDNLKVLHSWENMGVGVLPNNNRRWNFKYKVAFSLLDVDNNVVKKWMSENAEPSDWIRGKDYEYNESFSASGVSNGSYQLAVALINSDLNDKPSINLAVEDKNLITNEGWLKIGAVTIK